MKTNTLTKRQMEERLAELQGDIRVSRTFAPDEVAGLQDECSTLEQMLASHSYCQECTRAVEEQINELTRQINDLTWQITNLHESRGTHIYDLMDERHLLCKELKRLEKL